MSRVRTSVGGTLARNCALPDESSRTPRLSELLSLPSLFPFFFLFPQGRSLPPSPPFLLHSLSFSSRTLSLDPPSLALTMSAPPSRRPSLDPFNNSFGERRDSVFSVASTSRRSSFVDGGRRRSLYEPSLSVRSMSGGPELAEGERSVHLCTSESPELTPSCVQISLSSLKPTRSSS